jgi:hypothetical protein
MPDSNSPGVVTIVLFSTNVDASRDFLCDNLGFDVEFDTWLEVETSAAAVRRTRLLLNTNRKFAVELMQSSTGKNPASASSSDMQVPVFTVNVADCEAVAARLSLRAPGSIVAHGSTPFAEYLTVQDPSGNLIQLIEQFVSS